MHATQKDDRAGVSGRALAVAAAIALAPAVLSCEDSRQPVVDRVADAPAVDPSEYAERRTRILAALPDGVLLLQARATGKEMEQWGFIQNPSFFYFTGLSDLPEAILALDGQRSGVRLFVPPAPTSFGFPVSGVVPAPGAETATRLGVDAVSRWEEFGDWLERRLGEGATLYVDGARRPEATGAPDGFARVAGPFGLWRAALEARFPEATFRSAADEILKLRWQKSVSEIAILRRNARITANALLAVANDMRPGLTQREAEAVVVSTCIKSGGQGPSFWPWVMTGPNARIPNLVSAFFRYEQLDREMQAGELARVDIGCAGGFYGGDVGRTLPVSGSFTPGQAEAWDLLIIGYRAGLAAMEPGVTLDAVRDASVEAVEAARERMQTSTGRRAVDAILDGGRGTWHIHGVGVESGENARDTLAVGAVLAYEPGFAVDSDAFYLEDMIVITAGGHEVLSAGLPYSADEIERAMAGRW